MRYISHSNYEKIDRLAHYNVEDSDAPGAKLVRAFKTNLPTTLGSTVTVTGAATFQSTSSYTGAQTPTGGIGPAGGFAMPTDFSTGNRGVTSTTGLNQKQFVTTESYFAEIFVEGNVTLTGISVLNGHTTTASQNINVGLANSSGVIVASSATTTAQGAADSYQQIPFTSTYAALGPALYYIVVQGSQTTGFLATHAIGNFKAGKVTSETYGTFLTTASYSATNFTANLGPVADTY